MENKILEEISDQQFKARSAAYCVNLTQHLSKLQFSHLENKRDNHYYPTSNLPPLVSYLHPLSKPEQYSYNSNIFKAPNESSCTLRKIQSPTVQPTKSSVLSPFLTSPSPPASMTPSTVELRVMVTHTPVLWAFTCSCTTETLHLPSFSQRS